MQLKDLRHLNEYCPHVATETLTLKKTTFLPYGQKLRRKFDMKSRQAQNYLPDLYDIKNILSLKNYCCYNLAWS